MHLLKRSTTGLFASQTLLGHLLRGSVALWLVVWAIQHQSQTILSLLAALGALVAFRGCPICWTIGLVETIMQKLARN